MMSDGFICQSSSRVQKGLLQLALLWRPIETQDTWSSSDGTIFGSFCCGVFSLFWTTAIWRWILSIYLTSQHPALKLLSLVLVPSVAIAGLVDIGTWSYLWTAGSVLQGSQHTLALTDKESNEKTLVSLHGRKGAGSYFRWSTFRSWSWNTWYCSLWQERPMTEHLIVRINSATMICLLTDCLFRKSAELLVVPRKWKNYQSSLLDSIS